ncbi:MAG TPA: regulatory protein RecX [Blastocatellia bacterium]|jgi:regulatory protein|nr:regulatory protein RecX [Blastocatellia bacterium]
MSAEKARERLLATALKILAARPRSESQLRERLLSRPWAEPELVDSCIDRLKELGYVDDRSFAETYANHRVHLKPVGRSRIARELAGKKVARETINRALDEVFEEVDEESLIDRAIEKRVRTHGSPEGQGGAKRMFDHLARLGFQYDLIVRKLRALRAGIEEE